MRLTTAQLMTGWLHPRRVVRNVVASHFADGRTTDADVTAQAIRGAREFGWQRFLTWEHQFARLPLADEAAVEWVCDEVERTDDDAPSANLKWHLTRMLAQAEIGLADRSKTRILGLDSLDPPERQTLLTRLDLAACPPAEAWRRLEDHCRMAAAGKTFADANIPAAELLLEPLARAGDESVARVMDLLGRPPSQIEGDEPAEWLTGLMIGLAGRLRIEQAAPLIWDLMSLDWDWYYDEAEAALTRIGTPGVVQLVRDRYPQATWDVRLYATTLLSRILCPEATPAIAEALAAEDHDGLRAYLGRAAAAQFDDRLVPLARGVLDEDPADPERGEIRKLLVAFSHLSGHALPDRDDWERAIDELDERMLRLGDPADSPLTEFFRRSDDDDDDQPEDDEFGEVDLGAWGADDDDPAAEPLQRGVRVGRNALCPCGSGKKYKRCCLRDASG